MAMNIVGMGYKHGPTLIDNKFIEDLDIGTNADWILDKIGIETRLSTLPLEYIRKTRNVDPREGLKAALITPTEMAVEAADAALEKAGLKRGQIGLMIVNCCTPNQSTPSEAQRIAAAMNLKCKVYDVVTACPAFALHIDYLSNFKEQDLPDYIMCISTAALTQHVNYNERSDSAIWGDAAAAWIVSPRKPGKLKVLDTFFTADPTRCEAVVVNTFGHFQQDGRAVRDFSVRQTVRLLKRLEEIFSLDWEKDIFVGHQANRTMLAQIVNNRGIKEAHHWHNVGRVGNQAAAGAPVVIAENWDKIQPGQRLAVAVVGAGLSWGSVLLEAR